MSAYCPQHSGPGRVYRDSTYPGPFPDCRKAWAALREVDAWAAGPGNDRLSVDYQRRYGIDWDSLTAFAGSLTLASIELTIRDRFTFATDGEAGAVICALAGKGGERVIEDFVAWPVDEPHLFATRLGRASVLGSWHLTEPASFQRGALLYAHRTPLAWLQGGCAGICVLDASAAADALQQSLGPILAEDRTHASELLALIQHMPNPPRIGFREKQGMAA
jgi:hypothetical protein